MNNMIINPQLIGSQRTHRKINYIEQNSKNNEENIVFKIKEREEAIQLLAMDPYVCGELLTHHWKVVWMMQKSSVIDSPSSKVQEKTPRWDRGRIETCGGRKSVRVALCWFVNIWKFIEVELGQGMLQGAHELRGAPAPQGVPCGSWLTRSSSGLLPNLLGSLLDHKKSP